MEPLNGTIFIVDDDPKARKAVAALASSIGGNCESFASGEEFLDRYRPSLAGCAVIDIRLKGMDGLQLQERLTALGSTLPVILISAYADVPLAVRGMRNGALTLLEKPYQNDDLADAIRAALARNDDQRQPLVAQVEATRRLEKLTAREQQLVKLVISGMPNKQVARILGVCQRTVERRRAMVLEKVGVESAVALAQVAAGLQRSHPLQEPTCLPETAMAVRGEGEADGVRDGKPPAARLLDLWQRDRKLIAYDIHDGVAQYLTGAEMHLKQYERLRQAEAEEAGMFLKSAIGLVNRSVDEIRQLIHGLERPVSDDQDIVGTLDDLIGEYRPKANIDFIHSLPAKGLDPSLENAIYRIVQESLTNACQHSHGRRIRVEVAHRGNQLCVEIKDWGIGFDRAKIEEGRFGLRGIEERAKMLGGCVSIQSAPGKGTRVSVQLPLAKLTPTVHSLDGSCNNRVPA